MELWYHWIQSAIRKFIPKRTQYRASLPPWISKDTSNEILRLRTIQRKLENTNSKVRDIIQQVEAAAEADKVIFEEKLAEDRSTTALFKYFSAFRKENFPRNMTYVETSAENDLQKANLFANFFASVFIKSSEFNFPLHPAKCSSTLETIEISEKDVITIC